MKEQSPRSEVRLEFLLGKLDGLLLSLSSLLSIIYAVITITIHGVLILAFFIPISVLYFVPLWIGYIRGSITLDSRLERLEERIRGWIYLFGGTLGYVAHFSVLALLKWHILPFPQIYTKLLLFPLIALITLGVSFFLLYKRSFPGLLLHKLIYQRLDIEKPQYNTEKIVRLTNRNAIYLGVWLYGFSLLLARYHYMLVTMSILGLLLLGLAITMIQGERKIRHLMNKVISPTSQ